MSTTVIHIIGKLLAACAEQQVIFYGDSYRWWGGGRPLVLDLLRDQREWHDVLRSREALDRRTANILSRL